MFPSRYPLCLMPYKVPGFFLSLVLLPLVASRYLSGSVARPPPLWHSLSPSVTASLVASASLPLPLSLPLLTLPFLVSTYIALTQTKTQKTDRNKKTHQNPRLPKTKKKENPKQQKKTKGTKAKKKKPRPKRLLILTVCTCFSLSSSTLYSSPTNRM